MRAWTVAWLMLACSQPPSGDAPDDTEAAETDLGPAPEGQPPDQPGPYAVGATTLRVDRSGQEPLVVEVWYPALPAEGAVPGRYEEGVLGFEGGAFRDAPVDPRGGPYPVVAFSHGFGGLRFQSFFLTEHLAQHGFVVVAPDHAATSLADFRPDQTAVSAARRPSELAEAVDALVDVGVPGLTVDTSTYAAVGHSFGAWTALVVAGGQLDLPAFEAVCAAPGSPRACNFFKGLSFEGLPLEAAVPDPRATVVVALTPGAWYAFGADGAGLATVRAPLVIGGTLDDELPYDPETTGTYAALAAPKTLAAVQRAGHWSFTDLCALLPLADCAGETKGYLDPARTQQLVRTKVLAHVGLHLTGDPRWAEGLGAEPDLTWEDAP